MTHPRACARGQSGLSVHRSPTTPGRQPGDHRPGRPALHTTSAALAASCTAISNAARIDDGSAIPFPAMSNAVPRSEEHTSELQSHHDLVCRLLLEKKNNKKITQQLNSN